LADAGCPLTVGSDSNTVVDMLEEARGLELDQRRATGRRVLHQPEELFRAATVNGMRALGWEAGELKSGMLADFVCIDPARGVWRRLELEPLLFGSFMSAPEIKTVVVAGKTVVSR
jgi:cytosine/adenosine deaminase-related metal-dependent hydrolase